MTGQVKLKETDIKDEIIAKTGYWDVPLSAVQTMEREQKSARERAEFMRLNSKQISDIIKKW